MNRPSTTRIRLASVETAQSRTASCDYAGSRHLELRRPTRGRHYPAAGTAVVSPAGVWTYLQPARLRQGVGAHHSRLVERDEDGIATAHLDPMGLAVRLGHSIAFFTGTAYGSTETAERLAQTVRGSAPHHQGGAARRCRLRRRQPGLVALELHNGGVGSGHGTRDVSPTTAAR
jgi:hypothetical protein